MAANDQPSPRPTDDTEAYPYVLTKEIGTGSFATVFRGYHVKNRKAVAVKAVKTSILKAKLLDNLESEIAILKSLNHRHITALIDIVKAEKHVYIVMDYCSGGDLSMYIRARGKIESLDYVPEPGAAPTYFPHPKSGGLDQRVVRSLLLQLADALRFLRDRNLMHRDIKPQNLLLQPATFDDISRGHQLGAPILKVADFGFARILPSATMAETLCGSPLYMAPEILSYEKYDAKADLWSVGAVLYEMSVGRPPFRANNHIELLNKINRANSRVPFPDEDPAAIAKAHANKAPLIPVPNDIKALIRMLLRRNPVERASYEEFFNASPLDDLKTLEFFVLSRQQGQGGMFFSSNGEATSSNSSSKQRIQNATLGRTPRGGQIQIPQAPVSSRPAPKPPVAGPSNASSATSSSAANGPPGSIPDSPSGSGSPTVRQYFTPNQTMAPANLNTQPAAITNGTADVLPTQAGELPIGPDGQPYDPRLYQYQDTFHFNGGRRKEKERERGHRSKDRENEGGPSPSRSRSSRKSSGQSSPMVASDVVNKEYVLVDDTRAIEFNRVADEIEAARRKPSSSKPRKDRPLSLIPTVLNQHHPRTTSAPVIRTHNSDGSSDGQPQQYPPSAATNGAGRRRRSDNPSEPESDGATRRSPRTPATNYPPPPPSPPPPPIPPFAMPHRRTPSDNKVGSPTSAGGLGVGTGMGNTPAELSSSPRGDYAFPPVPQPSNGANATATPLIIKPSGGALARALNIASKKLFGSPTGFNNNMNDAAGLGGAGGSAGSPGSIVTRRAESDRMSSNPASPRYIHSQLPSGDESPRGGNISSGYNNSHAQTNGLGLDVNGTGNANGKKALGRFAGKGTVSPAEEDLLIRLDKLSRKAGVLVEWSDKKFGKVEAFPTKPLADPALFEKRPGEAPHRAESRRKREQEVEMHAVQCISLYFTVMSFSQKAIDLIRTYYLNEDAVASAGIDEALTWARESFSRSMQKVNTLKMWLPEGYVPPHMWIDRVIYDHALEMLKHAASVESRGENLQQCAEEYDRALWMLYAIEDDVLQAGNPYADQDRDTIASFIKSTAARVDRLRQRLGRLNFNAP